MATGFISGSTYFVHADRVGTTFMVTDSSGNVVQDELHYPWGQEWTMVGTLDEERFARLEHRDAETELDPTHFRMFSSGIGRWQSPDPMPGDVFNPQSFNRYAYALNNPTGLIDPTGLIGEPPP
ncbi:MAG: RHS repeat domain-containing protein [Gammaproteobacteria bacterium]